MSKLSWALAAGATLIAAASTVANGQPPAAAPPLAMKDYPFRPVPLTAVRVVEAIGRGFSPRRAARLLDEDSALELIDLRDYAGKSTNSMGRIRGRVIGVKGKSRRVIEELTDCYISVYGRSVAIIGSPMEVVLASEAVKMLASGSQHKTVYNTLQKARTKKKFERMFLWEGSSPDAVAARTQRAEGD